MPKIYIYIYSDINIYICACVTYIKLAKNWLFVSKKKRKCSMYVHCASHSLSVSLSIFLIFSLSFSCVFFPIELSFAHLYAHTLIAQRVLYVSAYNSMVCSAGWKYCLCLWSWQKCFFVVCVSVAYVVYMYVSFSRLTLSASQQLNYKAP